MHHADHVPARPESDPVRPSSSRSKPSPIVGFIVALALALGGWGVFWLTTREDRGAEPGRGLTPGGTEGIRLTDEQAIARLEELTALALQGLEARDPSLISRAYASGSPARRTALRDIRRLKDDNVVDKSEVKPIRFAVLSNQPREIRIRETIIVRFCFVSESGKDLSRGPAAIEQTGIWILRWERDAWLIHDTMLEGDRVVDKSDARCT